MELLNPLSGASFPGKTASFSNTAGVTDTWNAGPEGVVVWSDIPCYVIVGENVTATDKDTPIPASTPIPFKVPATVSGQWRVSAIGFSTTVGTLYTKPINSR